MNGMLRLYLNPKSKIPFLRRQHFVVAGGPYLKRPAWMVGVKLAVEVQAPCVVDIPSKDFGTPDRKVMYRGLHKALKLLVAGEPLYAGCMGGIGRTGLFLALLAKAFGEKDPVAYVRKEYLPHAVETAEQQAYVKKFTITPAMRQKIKAARRRQLYRVWTWHRQVLTHNLHGTAERQKLVAAENLR